MVDDHLRLSPDERRFLNTELKGLGFELDHISYRPKNLIHCLTDKPVSQVLFTVKSRDGGDSRETNVKDYYDVVYANYLDEKFGRKIYGNLPAVQVRRFLRISLCLNGV